MRVLFLALGGTRRRAVTHESAKVLASGGQAVVVVDQLGAWRNERFEPGVQVVELGSAELRQRVLVAERRILSSAPRALLTKIGRGPLRPWTRRLSNAYERRFATPLHRRVAVPLHRRLRPGARRRLLERLAGPVASFDVVVVSDPVAMLDASRLFRRPARDGVAVTSTVTPRVCYSVEHVAATVRQSPVG